LNKKIANIITYIILTLIAILFLTPLIWNVLTSIKPDQEIYSSTINILPRQPVLTHYIYVLTQLKEFYSYFLNTIVITFGTIIAVLMLSTTMGYAFGRLDFRGRGLFLGFILLVLTLPYAIYLIPIYIMEDRLNLIDTWLGLILPYIAIELPMAVFIMRGNFKTVPVELEEAAIIDGCNTFQVWHKIMLPIVKPGVATVALLTFIDSWGEFMFARTIAKTPASQTISVGITFLRAEAASWQYGTLTATITLSLMPLLIVFLAMQQYLIKGITDGAIKG
jgi:ABC-type glycerol-3-phosphate transport system permease component